MGWMRRLEVDEEAEWTGGHSGSVGRERMKGKEWTIADRKIGGGTE